MAGFVDRSYDALLIRSERIVAFYSDLEVKLADIGAPASYHMDIYWDGGSVRRVSDDSQISGLSSADKLKYYNQGLGLMKLAINKTIYPR